MRIGATAKHEFTGITNPNGETISKVKVVYAQNDKVVFTKEPTKDGNGKYIVNLSEEDVLKFKVNALVQIQVRVLTSAGNAYTSDIMTLKVYDGLEKTTFNTPAAQEE